MTDKNPLAHYSGLLTEAVQESAAANLPASGAVAQAAPLTRYCPECGHVGEVGPGHRDCCPDGSAAFMVPAKWAQELRAGLLARLGKAAPAAVAVTDERWRPDACPITGRKFFMWVTHHDTGADVPTYGGPFDSYTIPARNEDDSYSCERYDHDFGGWREWEDVGLTVVDDQSFVVEPDNQRYDEIRDFAEGRAALAATPAAAAQVVLPELGEIDSTAPERIYLVVNPTGNPNDRTGSFDNCAEVSWCATSQGGVEVAYVRADHALLAGVSAPAALAVEPTDAELIALNAGEWFFSESPSKYPELGHGTQYNAGEPGLLGFARAALALRTDPAAYSQKFQQRVQPWMMACFGPEISADRIERNHRFLEESLELVQSLGCTASEARQLVDYVFERPVGEPAQEAGGVMVTLAALCLASGLDMHTCGETELARIWTKVEAIRAKQAAKPKHSPLPMHAPQAQADARDAALSVVMAAVDDFGTAARIGTSEDEETKRKAVDAMIAGLMIDAEFYRWLRDENSWHAEPRLDAADGTVWKLTMYSPQEIMDPTDDDSLDAAIRAAIAAQAAQQGGAA